MLSQSNDENSTANSLLKKMTLDEKIGQMLFPATNALTMNYAPNGVKGAQAAWVKAGSPPKPTKELGNELGFQSISDFHLGAVLQAGGPILYSNTLPENQRMDQWQALSAVTQLYQTLDLPLLLGTDGIHGNQHVVGSILFPHNIGLGATHNPKLVNLVGQVSAIDIKESGFNWTFMPTVAAGHDYRWGRFYECYSSNNDVLRELSKAYIDGIQSNGVIACAKHFIGDGATYSGMDEGDSFALDLDTLWKENGAGYEGAVASDVGSIMASYNSLNGIPMHFGGDYDVLNHFRNEGIEFGGKVYKLNGFVVSDYDGIARAAWKDNLKNVKQLTLAEAMALSINGGVDMIMMSAAAYTNPFDPGALTPPNFENKSAPYYKNLEDVIAAIKEAVDKNLLSIERIDDAVIRILVARIKMKNCKPVKTSLNPAAISLQAAEESLVVLKNEQCIPQTSDKKFIFLLGDFDDIGKQNGGWTINWQGQEGNYYWTNQDRKTASASSILDGVKQICPKSEIVMGEYNTMNYPIGGLEGANATNSVAIIAISEFPYAEFMGDVANQNPLYYQGVAQGDSNVAPETQKANLSVNFTDEQSATIALLKGAGIPVITVLFSGRPVVISETNNAPLPASDGLIAAFLPGTSGGQAVANLIFGKYQSKSTKSTIDGKTYHANTLPFPWPASQIEVLTEHATLFPEGFGL